MNQSTETIPAFEEAVNLCIANALEREKGEIKPGLLSESAQKAKIASNISGSLHGFQKEFARGYQHILNELKEMLDNKELLSDFQPPEKNLSYFDNPVALIHFLSEGYAFYQLLGFSEKQLSKMGQAAYRLIEQNRFQDAIEAFFFLVTIAPHLGPCWYGLGYSYGKCDQDENAIQALLRAIELSPDTSDFYLHLAHIFIKHNDFEKATSVCDLGLLAATQDSELQATLEEAKHQINILAKGQKQ